MSIETEILAKNPVLYWPLDDPTGPAAVDQSGNGHTGVYGGPFILGSWGAVAGETAAQFGIGGFVRCTGLPQLGSAAFSLIWWMSINVGAPSSTTTLFRHTATGVSRGWFFTVSTTGLAGVTAYRADGTPLASATTSLGGAWKTWHPWVLTYSPGGAMSLGYDGGTVLTLNLTGGLATITAAETFEVAAGAPLIAAHVAYYDRLLSPGEISAIHAYRQDWPYGPPINATWPEPPVGGGGALSPSDPVVIDINTDLTDIRRAVIRDFSQPPPGPITP